MISVRPARPAYAPSIGAVHVAAWRSAYAGILPDTYLARLSVARQAAHYDAAIRSGAGVHVAMATGEDLDGRGGTMRIVGFTTSGLARGRYGLAEGEIETLYVLDDWRDRGIGRQLMAAAAEYLAGRGCNSAFLWVLRDNPSRWFYQRLGGKPAAEQLIRVGGQDVIQTAYVWSPIDRLVDATSAAP